MDFNALHVEGITHVTPEDITFARELGYRIKLLGIAEETPGGIAVRVHPALVRRGSPVAEVFGVMNAALVEAEPVDRMFFEGPMEPVATSTSRSHGLTPKCNARCELTGKHTSPTSPH